MRWWALVGVGVRATPPVHPPKRRHFTPNLLKRPVWKRFGVKFGE
ncbi:nucleosidase, partial [Corynebacterium diphtheriae]